MFRGGGRQGGGEGGGNQQHFESFRFVVGEVPSVYVTLLDLSTIHGVSPVICPVHANQAVINHLYKITFTPIFVFILY